MDCLEAIRSRRSIRQFDPKPLSEEQVQALLRAGMAAPSARNIQPWEFIVITDRRTLNSMAEMMPYGKMLDHCPLSILICGNTERDTDPTKPPYWVVDCAAVAQNILLAAHAMGLGGVWIGTWPREERMTKMIQLFKLPGHIIPHTVLAIGRPAEEGTLKDKFDPAKIHREGWPAQPPAK